MRRKFDKGTLTSLRLQPVCGEENDISLRLTPRCDAYLSAPLLVSGCDMLFRLGLDKCQVPTKTTVPLPLLNWPGIQ